MSGKQPDFRLAVSPRYDSSDDNRTSTRIGAAWKIVKDDQVIGINIKIDRGLPPMLMSSDFDLTLWNNEDKPKSASRRAPTPPPPTEDFGDDDIPF